MAALISRHGIYVVYFLLLGNISVIFFAILVNVNSCKNISTDVIKDNDNNTFWCFASSGSFSYSCSVETSTTTPTSGKGKITWIYLTHCSPCTSVELLQSCLKYRKRCKYIWIIGINETSAQHYILLLLYAITTWSCFLTAIYWSFSGKSRFLKRHKHKYNKLTGRKKY